MSSEHARAQRSEHRSRDQVVSEVSFETTGARNDGTFRLPTADLTVLIVATLIAVTTLHTVYSGFWYLIAGLAGLLLGLLAGWIANRRGWTVFTAVIVGLVPLVLGAGPLALRDTMISGVVPTMATLDGLWRGAIGGWRGLLTTVPPVIDEGPLLLVPYLGTFIAALAGMLLAARTRLLIAPVLFPGVLLVGGLLLGTSEPVSLLLHGTGFAAVALVGATMRQRRNTGSRLGGLSRAKRMMHSATIVVIGAALAWVSTLAPAVAGLPDRFVLREHVELPFDPSIYPSPLSGYRKFEVNQKEQVLFSIAGMPSNARIRFSVMDAYDGVVWTVAGAGGRHSASGVFERVGERIPLPADTTGGSTASVQMTVRDMGGVWIPTIGDVTGVSFPGQRGKQLTEAFRYNRVTGSGVLTQPSRLVAGDTINLDVLVPSDVDRKQLGGRPVADVTQPDLAGVPDQIGTAAVDWTAGQSGAYAQLAALETRMKTNGRFSDGTKLAGMASWSGHSAGRLREFLGASQLVGDSEQYAATFALMARDLGLPARVVLGVAPKQRNGSADVTGKMVTAWVEVKFAQAGWVPFDVTPDVSNIPDPPKPPSQNDGTTQVIQPPAVPELPPAHQPPPGSGEEPPPVPAGGCGWCNIVLEVLKYVGLPILVLAGICGIVIGLKARRRRRRRSRGTPRQRVAGAWLELLDRMRDHRIAVPDGQTRREIVTALYRLPDEQLQTAHKALVRGLAHRADKTVFGPEETVTTHTAFWTDVDEAVRSLKGGRSFWKRLRAALNPVTLLPAALSNASIIRLNKGAP